MKILNLAFSEGEHDKKAWSGTIYKTLWSLRNINEHTDFLPIKDIAVPKLLYIKIFLHKIFHKLGISKHSYAPTFSLAYRDAIKEQLKQYDFSDYDIFFVTASSVITSALLQIVGDNQKNKIVFLADAPFGGIENYYHNFNNLYRGNSAEANAIGKEVFTQVSNIIVSSQWAKDSAVHIYGANPKHITVIEFGANIDSQILGTRTITFTGRKSFNILLSGVDWERKGGDIAVSCCKKLIDSGLDVTLHIVGMDVPSKYTNCTFIKAYGFLNKMVPEEYEKYLTLWEGTDIFLFPSKAECAGIVLCEAAGFGVPTFCYDTGGVGNYVVNDINGKRLPLSATGEDFAQIILTALQSNAMDKYSQGAQQLYRASLNWNSWSQRVKNIL